MYCMDDSNKTSAHEINYCFVFAMQFSVLSQKLAVACNHLLNSVNISYARIYCLCVIVISYILGQGERM